MAILEDINGKFDFVIENIVPDIKDMKKNIAELKEDVGELKIDMKAVKAGVKNHEQRITTLEIA